MSISGELAPTLQLLYLGVYLDHKLTFQDHIHNLKENINKYVGIFYHIRHKLPPKNAEGYSISHLYSVTFITVPKYYKISDISPPPNISPLITNTKFPPNISPLHKSPLKIR